MTERVKRGKTAVTEPALRRDRLAQSDGWTDELIMQLSDAVRDRRGRRRRDGADCSCARRAW